MPPFNTPGRGRKNSTAYKRGNPANPTRDEVSPGPAPKRRLSNASAVLRPPVNREEHTERNVRAQTSSLPIRSNVKPGFDQANNKTSAEVASRAQDHVDHQGTSTGVESGTFDSLFTEDEDEDDDEDVADQHYITDDESDVDGERLLGDVAEKKRRSIKEITDSLHQLIKQHKDLRKEALDRGKATSLGDWLRAGNHLRHIYRGDEPLTFQETVVNKLVAMMETAETLKELIQAEKDLQRTRDFTTPGNAQPVMQVFEMGVYAERYTIEEALRRRTPLGLNPIDRGRTWAWPAPVMEGALVGKMIEGGRDWNPRWKSLDGPHLNLDTAIRRLRIVKERHATLSDMTPHNIREDARRALVSANRRVHQILMIRGFFANGYTLHPNQLVSPDQLPLEGLCTRSTLYILSICLRRLISIRDKDKKVGLCMSPIDFLRWRLSVMCRHHNHKGQALNRASIVNCILNVYADITERTRQGGDPLFRQVMIYATKVDGTEWHFQGKKRRPVGGTAAQSQEAVEEVEDSGDENEE